jgi:hypothetical protein
MTTLAIERLFKIAQVSRYFDRPRPTRSTVAKSPYRSLTPKKAKEKRTLVIWPVGVEKVRDRISFLPVMVAAAEFLLSPQL